jgi:hypothetical protein
MSTPQFETERRGLIRATLSALVIAAVPGAAATPPGQTPTAIRKASPPRGSYGIVQPGLKRTAFLNVPAGMTNETFRDYWINTYAPGLQKRGAQSIVFNLIDHENSPDTRFDAVIETAIGPMSENTSAGIPPIPRRPKRQRRRS